MAMKRGTKSSARRDLPVDPSWRDIERVEPDGAIRWTSEALAGCDPYLVWAEVTSAAGPMDRSEFATIGVFVELVRAEQLAWLKSECGFVPSGLEPVTRPTRFACGLVNHKGLRRLVAAVGASEIRRFTLQSARIDLSQQQWKNYRKFIVPPRPQSVQGDAKKRCSQPFIGIIDDGLPFAQVTAAALPHVSLWDQGWLPEYLRYAQDGLPATPPSLPALVADSYWVEPWTPGPPARGFFYGRRLNPIRPLGPERETYAAAKYFDPPPARMHGAGVLGRLAPWMSGRRATAGVWPKNISGLAMVQLPSLTVEDTSGATLANRVLDGLRFVLWQEEESRPAGARARCVVANLSYGIHAGPHDGTSMFEAALAETLDTYSNLHLVLPAGNAHRARCHSGVTLKAKEAHKMPWKVLPDCGRDTFMEIWVKDGAQVCVEILPPGHTQPVVIRQGEAKVYASPVGSGGELLLEFGVVFPPSVAQGPNGTMVLIAISPTRRLGSATGIGMNQLPRRLLGTSHGLWHVTVFNKGDSATRVDAWVERGDAAPDSTRGHRQAFFPDSETDPPGSHPSNPAGTLNGIATLCHERLHVVGAMRELDGRLADYSAAGPRRGDHKRDHGPDVVVKADRSHVLPGLPTSGFMAGTRTHLNGTSIACAVFAEQLVQILSSKAPPQLPALPPDAPPEEERAPEHPPRAQDNQRGQMLRYDRPADPKPPIN
jgi:hypothetical protein